MKKIRWGIVGPGNIANKFAQAIMNVERAKLSAVASRSKERGQAFAAKYNIPNIFSCYEEMAQSGSIDAVYIATPHPFHKPCAELFLNAKKHVLCEKPVCINTEQAIKLKKCAESNGVFLMEAMWTRFLPAVQTACKLVRNGEIGEVMGLSADFCYSSTYDEEPKLFQNDMAGGSLLDVGIYGLHFASLFLGTNTESICTAAQIENGVDCHTNVLLKYKNGAIAKISSAINLYKPESAYIYGTKGFIYMPCFYGANEFFITIGDNERKVSKPSIGNGFEEEIYEACECIRAGKTQSDILPMDKSIEILKQMDCIRKQINIKYPFDGEDF